MSIIRYPQKNRLMRKLIVYNWLSLDGLIDGPNNEIDWFSFDNEIEKENKKFFSTIDTIFFGKTTYKLMVSYWPTEKAKDDDPEITEMMNTTRKVVFSTTLDKVEWNNTSLVKENAEETVKKIKQSEGKDIVILGSGKLVSSFTKLGLIDEYKLIVSPVILGRGTPEFTGINDRIKLALINSKSFPSGGVMLTYKTTK